MNTVVIDRISLYMYHVRLLLMFYNRNTLKNQEERDCLLSGKNTVVSDRISLYMNEDH